MLSQPSISKGFKTLICSNCYIIAFKTNGGMFFNPQELMSIQWGSGSDYLRRQREAKLELDWRVSIYQGVVYKCEVGCKLRLGGERHCFGGISENWKVKSSMIVTELGIAGATSDEHRYNEHIQLRLQRVE